MFEKKCYGTAGVTFLELILVLVIIAIGAALAVPKLKLSVENREAKAVLETLRSISHAARMYAVTKGELPQELEDLETVNTETGTRYLDPAEYAFSPPYGYYLSRQTGPERNIIYAWNLKNNRQIRLHQCPNVKGKDGQIEDRIGDSEGFLTAPAVDPC